MNRKVLIMYFLTGLLIVGCTLGERSKRGTPLYRKDKKAIHMTLRLYERMFLSEDLKIIDDVFHPMALICWQSENPHTLTRKEYLEVSRETYGRRNYRNSKIYNKKIDITGNIATLSCEETHSFYDTDFVDKYFVDMILVNSQQRWLILTKVTKRQ